MVRWNGYVSWIVLLFPCCCCCCCWLYWLNRRRFEFRGFEYSFFFCQRKKYTQQIEYSPLLSSIVCNHFVFIIFFLGVITVADANLQKLLVHKSKHDRPMNRWQFLFYVLLVTIVGSFHSDLKKRKTIVITLSKKRKRKEEINNSS